jgi:hypothetical protein
MRGLRLLLLGWIISGVLDYTFFQCCLMFHDYNLVVHKYSEANFTIELGAHMLESLVARIR